MNFSGQADRARIQALEEYDGQAYKFHNELLSAFLYLFTEERIDVFAMAGIVGFDDALKKRFLRLSQKLLLIFVLYFSDTQRHLFPISL